MVELDMLGDPRFHCHWDHRVWFGLLSVSPLIKPMEIFGGILGLFLIIVAIVLVIEWLFFPVIMSSHLKRIEKIQKEHNQRLVEQLRHLEFFTKTIEYYNQQRDQPNE